MMIIIIYSIYYLSIIQKTAGILKFNILDSKQLKWIMAESPCKYQQCRTNNAAVMV